MKFHPGDLLHIRSDLHYVSYNGRYSMGIVVGETYHTPRSRARIRVMWLDGFIGEETLEELKYYRVVPVQNSAEG